MTTRKSRRYKKKHLNKTEKEKENSHHKSKKRHRKKRTVVSWKDYYTYESLNPSPSPSITNKNNGNIVNGLRDFLALKKDKK